MFHTFARHILYPSFGEIDATDRGDLTTSLGRILAVGTCPTVLHLLCF